jgi:hypothetical protein
MAFFSSHKLGLCIDVACPPATENPEEEAKIVKMIKVCVNRCDKILTSFNRIKHTDTCTPLFVLFFF